MNGQLTVVERRADPVVGLAVTSLGGALDART